MPSPKPTAPRPALEALEDRNLMAVLPVLNSLPGAAHTLFLDFNGHEQPRVTANGVTFPRTTVLPYSTDADASTLSDADVRSITEIWRRVAEDFAPFGVNVTTVQPSSLAPGATDGQANGRALRIAIGERDPANSDRGLTGAGGPVARPPVSDHLLGSYNSALPNTRFVHPNRFANAYELANAVSKGAGHSYGLRNQSAPTTGSRLAILGDTSVRPELRHTWHNGTNELGQAQDDVAVLTRVLGARPDEANATAANAAPLRPVQGVTSNGTPVTRLAGSGVIGTATDADHYSFVALGNGTVTFRLNFGQGVNTSLPRPADGPGANLAARVEVWTNNGGAMVASFDAIPPISSATPQGQELTLRASNIPTIRGTPQLLPGSRYIVVVRSAGGYGDLGNYTLTVDGPVGFGPRVVSAAPSPFPSNSVPRVPGPGVLYEARSVRVTFDRAMDPATFTAADVFFTGPNGPIAITSIVPVNAADPRQFDILFAVQSTVGTYTMQIGPRISTQRAGGPVIRPTPLTPPALEMDQDQDGIGGEAGQDVFTVSFSLGDNFIRPPDRRLDRPWDPRLDLPLVIDNFSPPLGGRLGRLSGRPEGGRS